MGPKLKMSFKIGDHQSIEVTHQNDYDSIIIYNDLYHKEDLLEIQFYDDIKYYKGTYKRSRLTYIVGKNIQDFNETYRRFHLTYIVGKNPQAFNATIKTIIDHSTDISFDCCEMTYEEFFKTIEWLVESMEPNKRFIFEYTNEYDDAAEDIVKYCTNDVLATEDAYNAITGDNVNHPSHYETGKFECFDVMREALGDNVVKDFCIANTFKYIYRHKRKNGVEDIKKAKWYIDKYLELEESNND